MDLGQLKLGTKSLRKTKGRVDYQPLAQTSGSECEYCHTTSPVSYGAAVHHVCSADEDEPEALDEPLVTGDESDSVPSQPLSGILESMPLTDTFSPPSLSSVGGAGSVMSELRGSDASSQSSDQVCDTHQQTTLNRQFHLGAK